MRDVLLVAGREFRQILSTRGFWVMLLIVPLMIGISGFVSSRLAPKPGVAFTLVDRSGRFDSQLQNRLEFDRQRIALRELSTYVERWKLGSVDPTAPWAQRGSWLADGSVRRFAAAGGADAALKRLRPHLPPGATAFEMPERLYYRIAPPAGAAGAASPAAFGKAVAPALKEDIATPTGKLPLAMAIYIPPPSATPGPAAYIWTNGRPSPLMGVVMEELTASMKTRILQANGISPAVAAQLQALRAPIAVTEPPVGQERGIFQTRSIIPIALVYLLLITAITTGSMMLQGVVEERSNKLLESVLACVRPTALMNGKLLGLGGVGLGIILVWAGCAAAAASFSTGGIADALRTSLEGLAPWMFPAMLFYFLAGYLIVSMLFLAIGSVSDSMQDAQSYLTPVLMAIMMPVIFLMQAALRDPHSVLTQVLSWIPLYTPFAMLVRLGTGVSLAEVIGTTVLLVAFVALELAMLGRLFQASVLGAGKPSWKEIGGMMRASAA
jgi:ABC-type Na+ efflux pump permease subunit